MIAQEFFLLGALLFIGYFSLQFFKKTGIPDVLLLMAVGVLLGPVFGFSKTVSGAAITSFAPLIGTAALIIILFDGGINLNFFKVIRDLFNASVFTVLTFVLTVVLSGALMTFFGWPFLQGLLLGAVLGGTSSAIVFTVVSQLKVKPDVKIILGLESALTDALCVIVALALMQFMTSATADFNAASASIASAFSIAIVGGLLLALVWAWALRLLNLEHFGYMLTLAFIFITYSVIDYFGGSGAVGVLIFGLMLANMDPIARAARMKNGFVLSEEIRQFQREISFFVRTFFFIYIGFIFDLSALSLEVTLISVAFVAIALIARALAVKAWFGRLKQLRGSELILISMMPRGLAAAVLATLPFSMGVGIPMFAEIVFMGIFFTNIITTIGVFFFESGASESVPAAYAKPPRAKPQKRAG